MLNLVRPTRPDASAPCRQEARQDSHKDAGPSSRAIVAPLQEPVSLSSSSTATKKLPSKPRSRNARSTRPTRCQDITWQDVKASLGSRPVFRQPSRQPSPTLHPAQLTALIQASKCVPDLAEVLQQYGTQFNEVHVMCAVSRLSNLQRHAPRSSAAALTSGSAQVSFQAYSDDVDKESSAVPPCSSEATALLSMLLPLAVPLLPRLTPRLLSGILSPLARMGAPPLPPSLMQAPSSPMPYAEHAAVAGFHATMEGDLRATSGSSSSSASTDAGNAYWSALIQLVNRSAEVMHEANADQGCHLLWAAVKLGCPSTGLMVAAAECVLDGSWAANDSQYSPAGRHAAQHQHPGPSAGYGGDARWLPHWLRPMLLWSLSQGGAAQLRQPTVEQLLQLLLSPSRMSSSITAHACMTELPLSCLVTALYACGLLHDTLTVASQEASSSSSSSSSGGGVAPGGEAQYIVSPATVDMLCEEILRRVCPAQASQPTAGHRAASSGLAGAAAAGTAHSLSSRAVSNCLLALSRLQHPHPALAAHLIARSEQLLASSLAHPQPKSDPTHQTQLRPAQGVAQGRGFTNQELCNSVMSLGHLQLQCPGLLQQLGCWLRANAQQLSARDAGELLYSLAILQLQQEQRNKNQQQQQQQRQQLPSSQGDIPHEAVHKLADIAYRQLGQYSPRNLVGLLWDLQRLGCPHSGISSRVAASLLQQVAATTTATSTVTPSTPSTRHPDTRDECQQSSAASLLPLCELEPDEISRLCCVLAAPGSLPLHGEERSRILSMVADEAREWSSCMSSEELIVALEAFAQLQHPCPELLEAACSRASRLSPDMTPTQLLRLAWSLARLEGPCSQVGGMAGVAARELMQQLAAGPLAAVKLQELTVADLTKLCWSYAYAEIEPGWELLSRLSFALCSQASHLHPADLGSVCWALARFQVPEGTLQQLAGTALALLQSQEQELQQQHGQGALHVDSMSPPTLATIAFSLAQRRALPVALMLALLRSALRQQPAVRASDAARLLWSLSMCMPRGAVRHNAWLLNAVAALVSVVSDNLVPGGNNTCSSEGSSTYRSDGPGAAEGRMAPGKLSLFLAACSGLEYHPGEEVLQEASQQLLPHVSGLRSQALCQLLAAMVTLRAGQLVPPSSTSDGHGSAHSTSGSATAAAAAAAPSRGAVLCVDIEASATQQQQPGVSTTAATQQLLCAIREVLTRRLCVEQLEVLGLGQMVRLAWALACRSDLWRSNRTDVLLLKALQAARRGASGVKRGGPGDVLPKGKARRRLRRGVVRAARPVVPRRVVPRLLMHAAARTLGAPPSSFVRRPLLQKLQEETRMLLQAECQPRSTWRALRQRWAKARQAEQGGAPSAPEQQLAAPASAQALHVALLPAHALMQEQRCANQVSDCLERLGLSSDSRWMRLPQGDGVCVFKAWPADLQRLSEETQGPRSTPDEQQRGAPTPRSRASPPITFAVYMVGAHHRSCDASHQELAGSTIRARMLRSRGYKVLSVEVDEWLSMSKAEQGQAVETSILQACAQRPSYDY